MHSPMHWIVHIPFILCRTQYLIVYKYFYYAFNRCVVLEMNKAMHDDWCQMARALVEESIIVSRFLSVTNIFALFMCHTLDS